MVSMPSESMETVTPSKLCVLSLPARTPTPDAFPALVPSCKGIRVCFTDGCQAMISELKAACGIGKQFQFAQMFRCMFHLITKSIDDQFDIAADGWQTEVKNCYMDCANAKPTKKLKHALNSCREKSLECRC